MTIKAYRCNGSFEEIELGDIDDLMFLMVTVISGDEIIDVYREDEDWWDPYLDQHIDINASDRTRDFFDAIYTVKPEDLQKWNDRTDSYFYKHVQAADRLKGLYYNVYPRYNF